MRIRVYRGDGYTDLMNVPENTQAINVYKMGDDRLLDVAGELEGQTPVATYRRTELKEQGLVVFR